MGKRRFYLASIAVLAFALFCLAAGIVFAQGSLPSAPIPSKQLDLTAIGYQDLSAMARRSDAVNLSLNFVDDDHVLFTFNPRRMFERLPDCPRTHDDRLVHAAVFELSTGKVVKQAEWYLHDSRRYLWSLGEGKLLLRRLNSFYIVDSALQERLVLNSPKDVLWTSVTPDGKQIVIETPDDTAPSGTKEGAGSKSRVRFEFIDAETLAVQRAIKSEKPVNLEATSTGFASVTPGLSGKVWLIRFGLSDRERTNIARVRSRRAPDVLYLSSNVLLIGRDSIKSPGYSVSSFTVTGNRLWRQHWDAHRYTPVITTSADGSRFAMSTLKLVDASPKNSTEQRENDVSEEEGLEQRIQVLDTASGDSVLSVTASPVVLNGLNYSLSPDGRRMILLRGTTLELYELPQMSPDEQARYTAVKADVPGLYIPPTEGPKDETDTGQVFTSAEPGSESTGSEGTASQALNNGLPGGASATSGISTKENVGPAAPGGVSAGAADDGRDRNAVLIFKSNTQVVALDVVVTDNKGHPAKGVPRTDFIIKEDGKPQTINYFDEVSADKTPAAPTVQGSAREKQLPPNIFTNDSPSRDENAITLILYDELNTPIVEQRQAKLELLKFLERKPKGASFAFCVLSQRLQMVQGFTPDESSLMRAAKSQNGSLRYNSMLMQDLNNQQTVDWLTQGAVKLKANTTGAGNLLDAAGQMEEEEAWIRGRDLETRMWLTMDAFTQLARYLAGVPGRKSLIWLSGSFPLGIFPGVDLRNPNTSSDSYTAQVKQAVNLLAESHIALYPVDVRGLSVYSMLTPSFSNSADTTQPAAESQSPFVASSDQKRFSELGNLAAPGTIGANLPGGDTPFMEEVTEHGIMDQIASETGGKAFYNSNGIEQAMATAVDQESNYYALSYTPSNRKYDGKFRKIKVSLAPTEKKLQVIYRSGYFAVDPNASSLSRDVKTGFGIAAMQHGSPQSHQVVFAAQVIPIGKPRQVGSLPGLTSNGARKNKKQAHSPQTAEPVDAQHYTIDYAIAPTQLHFDAESNGIRHATTNFMVASFDDAGTIRTSIVSRSASKLDPEGYQEVETGGLRLHQEVDVPANASFLRIGVQDATSGRMGTIEIHLPLKAVAGVEQQRLHSMPSIEPD